MVHFFFADSECEQLALPAQNGRVNGYATFETIDEDNNPTGVYYETETVSPVNGALYEIRGSDCVLAGEIYFSPTTSYFELMEVSSSRVPPAQNISLTSPSYSGCITTNSTKNKSREKFSALGC